MKAKTISSLVTISLLILASFSLQSIHGTNTNLRANANDEIVIYTYDSLLADPGYNFTGAFEEYMANKGSPVSVKLVLFEDANTILTRLILEKDNPQADVVIGLDNVLVHRAKAEGVLEPYISQNVQGEIPSELITNLDPDHYLQPYDFGIISFWADKNRVGYLLDDSQSITLDDFRDNSTLASLLIVENPVFSSPGLGFLLWTIAVYGDEDKGISGVLGQGDWKEWWKETAPYLRIVKSWGDAIDEFFAEEANRPIMISYGTSPSYGYCQWQDNSTWAFVSHENNRAYAWYQVEGIGLVKGASNPNMAKEFIDWFLSEDLQQHIPENQWMYPANSNVTLPQCFLESALHPNNVTILNSYIGNEAISQYLDTWLDEWEEVIAGVGKQEDSILPVLSSWEVAIVLGLVAFVTQDLIRRRRE